MEKKSNYRSDRGTPCYFNTELVEVDMGQGKIIWYPPSHIFKAHYLLNNFFVKRRDYDVKAGVAEASLFIKVENPTFDKLAKHLNKLAEISKVEGKTESNILTDLTLVAKLKQLRLKKGYFPLEIRSLLSEGLVFQPDFIFRILHDVILSYRPDGVSVFMLCNIISLMSDPKFPILVAAYDDVIARCSEVWDL